MRRYLVVANQTLGGEPLLREIRACRSAEPSSFHVVVPATPVTEHGTWTEGKARAVAHERLDRMLASLRAEGAAASGEVGDANPLLAIDDALRRHEIDEIIISTLPPGISRWLHQDLVHRVARRFDRLGAVAAVDGEVDASDPGRVVARPEHGGGRVDAGVVDEDVDAPVVRHGIGDDGPPTVGRGDVEAHHARSVQDVAHDHQGTLFGEAPPPPSHPAPGPRP